MYIISVLVSLEGSLSSTPRDQWSSTSMDHIFGLLRCVFTCLAVAMRYEPANAKYFQVEMNCGESMVETVRLLGCFSAETKLQSMTKKPSSGNEKLLQQIFSSEVESENSGQMPKNMYSSFVVIRMLYDMAVDNYDKSRQTPLRSLSSDPTGNEMTTPPVTPRSKKIPNLNLTPTSPEPVIVHPGIVTTILKLLPSLYFSENVDLSSSIQLYTAEILKSLLRTEKNQQIMCDVGFISDLLTMAKAVLEDEANILHSPFQNLLERLSAQKLEPQDLRTFLRLGNPLNCQDHDEKSSEDNQKTGNFIPLTRIKTLVSMTTPRDLHVENNCILPPFIEFDMAPEGFGCLFLPSLAPSSPHSSSGNYYVIKFMISNLQSYQNYVMHFLCT